MEKHDLEILNLLNFDKQYYDTFCTQLYMALNNIDFEDYFQKIRMLWDNKDITIICGDRIFNNLKYNIFDNAKSIEYQYCSSEDAFYEYEEILAKAKKIEKNKLIFIILGPTATILAYDLANLGYRAIDFGHIAKDFNAYKCKINNNLIEDTVRFFDPD
ncbi:MAG: DUF1792 domain-containing protein [Treponema sp.]|nr:DUF1792 domain-containing protein [Treponema sp.]